MPSKKPTLFFILILAALLGCSDPVESPKDRMDAAYKKVDRGQHDEAILELEALLAETNGDSVRQALASAYAARAGVSIEGYWQFMASFALPDWEYGDLNQRFIERAIAALKKKSDYNESPFMDAGESLESVLQALSVMQEYAYRLELLKALPKWPNSDMERALGLLGQMDPSRKGAYLYRSLLRMIVIKTLVVQRAPSFRIKDETDQCLIHTDYLKEGIGAVGLEVRHLISDLQLVYPSQKQKFERHDKFLQMLMGAIAFVPEELDMRDHNVTVINLFFQLDKGLWQCQ